MPIVNISEAEQEENRKNILKLLAPLFRQACDEKKWFLCKYQGMIFSPKELKAKHEAGELVWGPSNWQLIDPPDFIDIDKKVKEMMAENVRLANRISGAWNI
jgi:hypothetical protein